MSVAELRGGADMAALMVTHFPNVPHLGGIAYTNGWRYFSFENQY